jgi:fatty acid desaturase
MRGARPTSLTVLAIFHFIFGGLGLACGLFGLVGMATGMGRPGGGAAATADQKEVQDMQKKLEDALEKESPAYKTRQPFFAVLSLLTSVMLLVSGLGLWNMSSWARPVNLIYAALSLIHSLASLFFALAYDIPITNKVIAEMPAAGQQAAMTKQIMGFAIYGAVGFIVLAMIYPIITIIVMLLPSTVRAFGPTSEEEDFGDQPDRREPGDYDDRRERPGGEGFTTK